MTLLLLLLSVFSYNSFDTLMIQQHNPSTFFP